MIYIFVLLIYLLHFKPSNEFAKASLPEEIKAKGFSAKVNVIAEDIIEKGSCVVIVNNGGVIDANFKTQLAVLQNAFGIYQGGI